MIGVLFILVVVVILVVMVISIFNRLVKLRNMTEEGWSGIDVQLKKRADLIPNLIETVRGYMTHERELLEEVTKSRAQAQGAGDMAEKAQAEGLLGRALGKLFAVAENYPDLKANENFLELQNSLSDVENTIEMARRYYNGSVRELNIAVESFPSNLVASMFGFHKSDFFEIESADREVPKVRF